MRMIERAFAAVRSSMRRRRRRTAFPRIEPKPSGRLMLHRGKSETVRFPSAMRGGGRLSLLARGSEVSCSAFGTLTVDTPFVNRVTDTAHETAFSNRFTVTGTGPAKLIASYAPE